MSHENSVPTKDAIESAAKLTYEVGQRHKLVKTLAAIAACEAAPDKSVMTTIGDGAEEPTTVGELLINLKMQRDYLQARIAKQADPWA